jgi:hypothetical protein
MYMPVKVISCSIQKLVCDWAMGCTSEKQYFDFQRNSMILFSKAYTPAVVPKCTGTFILAQSVLTAHIVSHRREHVALLLLLSDKCMGVHRDKIYDTFYWKVTSTNLLGKFIRGLHRPIHLPK